MSSKVLVGDGMTDCTAALQAMLNKGGDICIEEGVYKTGPLTISTSCHLTLKKGAVLKFIPDFDLYEPVYTRWEGVKCYCMHPCLYIHKAEDVVISGSGTLDGSGEVWWEETNKKKGIVKKPTSPLELKFAALNPGYENQPGGGGGRLFQFLRPPLVQIHSSKRVTLEGITLQNSPFWTLHPLFSEDLLIQNVTIHNPYEAPNTDGIDVESCKNVTILNCDVFVGDDGICLKSGSGPDGIKDAVPTENVFIRGCKVHAAHGGAVIGSETAAGIFDVEVEDCYFDSTDRGIRIKSRRGRGGAIRNLTFRNLTMRDNLCPIAVNMFYRCGCSDMSLFSLEKQSVSEETPSVSNVEISNCHASGSKASAGMLVGLPEMPINNLTITDCHFGVDPSSKVSSDESDMFMGLPKAESKGLRIRYANGIRLTNVTVNCEGKSILLEDGAELI